MLPGIILLVAFAVKWLKFLLDEDCSTLFHVAPMTAQRWKLNDLFRS